MAQYSHLPIYNTSFDLLYELYKRIPKFSKQYKYLLGGEVLKLSTESVRLIIEINNTRDLEKRKNLLSDLIWQSELIIINLRIANKLEQLGSEKSYLYLVEKVILLGKQAEGWRKSIN